MLAQNESDPNLDRSIRTNSIKIILSAMWFTDTAGVDSILIEYRPPKSELATPAYKFYSSIYRLCYSFHSSLEEIVDFVDTIRPDKLFSIALPDSTSEQQISEYFYDSNGRFMGYRPVRASGNDSKSRESSFSSSPLKKQASSDKLVLRKRKSCDLFGRGSDSSDCSSLHSDNDGLIFGDDSSNDGITDCKKKLKS